MLTIGYDYGLKTLRFNEDHTVKLGEPMPDFFVCVARLLLATATAQTILFFRGLWDISGNDRMRGLATQQYYRQADGAFIVYDVTRPNTREMVYEWYKDLTAGNPAFKEDNLPIVLLANKSDLTADDSGTVYHLQCMIKDPHHNFLAGFQTSAKNDVNLDAAADTLVAALMERVLPNFAERNIHDYRTIRPGAGDIRSKTKCCKSA